MTAPLNAQQTKVLNRIEHTLLSLALKFWYYNAMWRGEAIALASCGESAETATNNKWNVPMKSAAYCYTVELRAFMQFAAEQGKDGETLMANPPAAGEIWLATEFATRVTAHTEEQAVEAFAGRAPTVVETVGRMHYWLKEA